MVSDYQHMIMKMGWIINVFYKETKLCPEFIDYAFVLACLLYVAAQFNLEAFSC